MRCSMPACRNRGMLWFNIWLVCEECFDNLMKRKIEQKHKILKGGLSENESGEI